MAKINMDGTKGTMALIFIVTLNSQKTYLYGFKR